MMWWNDPQSMKTRRSYIWDGLRCPALVAFVRTEAELARCEGRTHETAEQLFELIQQVHDQSNRQKMTTRGESRKRAARKL